jgi:hypothetical protein
MLQKHGWSQTSGDKYGRVPRNWLSDLWHYFGGCLDCGRDSGMVVRSPSASALRYSLFPGSGISSLPCQLAERLSPQEYISRTLSRQSNLSSHTFQLFQRLFSIIGHHRQHADGDCSLPRYVVVWLALSHWRYDWRSRHHIGQGPCGMPLFITITVLPDCHF